VRLTAFFLLLLHRYFINNYQLLINKIINKMKPTLLLLAAGMGSRYGGLKQLDGLGPNGETIMDYSIYDAIQAGFGKIVFVIRKDFEDQFREKILSKYEGHIPRSYSKVSFRSKASHSPWAFLRAIYIPPGCHHSAIGCHRYV
jgi:hypothetical protein